MPPKSAIANTKPFKPPRPNSKPAARNTAPPDSSPSASDDEPSATQEAASSRSHPAIPSALLSRTMHDNFKHADTRMTKEALAVVEKYIELFTREAVVRTVMMNQEQAKSGGDDDGFLDIKDLERIVPQLLLDF